MEVVVAWLDLSMDQAAQDQRVRQQRLMKLELKMLKEMM